MSDLATYVVAWRESAERIVALCAGLGPGDWSRPTDLPGWSVQDVVAHLADIEAQLAGLVEPRPGRPSATGQVPPEWTSPGVEARRGLPPAEVVAELDQAIRRRADALRNSAADDPGARPAVLPAGVDWDARTLLRNRVVDVWVHEQDIRRAVGVPDGMSSLGAEVAVDRFAGALPFVLGRKVAPPAGTEVAWAVRGEVPLDVRLMVGDDGRAAPADGEQTAGCTRLSMDTETFLLLAAGRRDVDRVVLDVDGDLGLARQVAAAMAVTP